MARKIKFPLEMKNGVKVRTIEELRENFSMEKAISYYSDGRLLNWLKDRYYDIESEKILKLDKYSKDFKQNLCEILGVQFIDDGLSLESIEIKNKRISYLKQFTEDEEIIKQIDMVAFNQEEVEKLVKEHSVIYLVGDEFEISLKNKDVSYIGINMPCVYINSKKNSINLDELNISFNNVFIKSRDYITIKLGKSKKIKLDATIKTMFIPSKMIKNLDISNDDCWKYTKFDMYKNYLIYWNNRSDKLNILDVNTYKEILNKNDTSIGWRRINNAKKYKDFLIILSGEYKDSELRVIDLKTLKTLNVVYFDSSSDVYGIDAIIDAHNNKIGLYDELFQETKGCGDGVKFQYHNIDTLELIERGYLKVKRRYDGYWDHGTTYNGYAYSHNSYENNIFSNKKNYKCEGLWDKNKKGAIGKFRIKKDKIYATTSREYASNRKQYNSIPNEGEICEFDLNGGQVKRRFQTEFKEITDFICLEDSIAIWNENYNKIIFYSFDTLEKTKVVEVPVSSPDTMTRVNMPYVTINEEEEKMGILCNGKIFIYE